MPVRALAVGIFAVLHPVLLWFVFNEQYARHLLRTQMPWDEYSKVMDLKEYFLPYGVYAVSLVVLGVLGRKSLIGRAGRTQFSRSGVAACAALMFVNLAFIGDGWLRTHGVNARSAEMGAAYEKWDAERKKFPYGYGDREAQERARRELDEADERYRKSPWPWRNSFMYFFASTCGVAALLFRSLRPPLNWLQGAAAYLAGYFLGLALVEACNTGLILASILRGNRHEVLSRILLVGAWGVMGAPLLWCAFRSKQAASTSDAS